ncbi:hypothetical protein NBH08_28005 [Faecalicatena sp. BF-R-105]|nr:hypothetical protein [Faecalicatena sp. BF-R-105]
MKLEEKQEIAATARKLIRLLMSCDDDFVDLVMCCVQDADTTPIEPEYL